MHKNKMRHLLFLFFPLTVLLGLLLLLSIASNTSEILSFFEYAYFSSKTIFAIILATLILVIIPLIILTLPRIRKSRTLSSLPHTPQAEPSESSEITLGEIRFPTLTEIDTAHRSVIHPRYNSAISLAELCERFRHFSASKLGLYYDIADIRRFIAGMTVSHILIMQGMSGTGKTSLAVAFGEFLKNESVVIPIQPMWKERADMVGYYNDFTKRFSETKLLQTMYEASYNDEIYIIVLDEMNIARVEYYFAEFLSLLELPNPEGRYIDIVSDVQEGDPLHLKNGRLKLPTNIWFIGTANNDDSTFAISDKVYDRAMIMNLDKKATLFEPSSAETIKISASVFDSLAKGSRRSFRMTWRNRRRLATLDAYMIDKFKITFGNRIMKQIEEYIPAYLACGGKELEALDDILSKKVFRKLETQNPIYVRNSAEALSAFLDDLFGFDAMPLCKDYLRKFERSA